MIKLTTGILMLSSAFLSSSYAASLKYHPGHLFIKMKAGQKVAKSDLIKSSKKIMGSIYLVKTNNPVLLERELQLNSKVEYSQKDFYGSAMMNSAKHEFLDPIKQNMRQNYAANFDIFNDPDVGQLWGFGDEMGMKVTSAYAALPLFQPEEVIVAVVDTGVESDHEDLKSVMWSNPGEIEDDGIDNDGNGYIDDIHGINTLVRDSNGDATMNTEPSYLEGGGFYHGTHVAGTIAATQNNGLGMAGVASNAKIMAIRTVPDAADELDSDIVEGFKYAAKMGAKIINCSYGKNLNEGGMIVRDVMNEIAKTHGVMIVVAAGNSTQNIDAKATYPASFDNESMLVVAASSKTGGMAFFSNYGKINVDVAAPGTEIYSTLPGNTYGSLSGTSMASPNTAGVAAMIRGYFPKLSPVQVKKVIMDTVTAVPVFKTKMVTGGRIDLKAALQKAAKI